MSAFHRRLFATLTLFTLAGLVSAQDRAAEVEKLRKQNAVLAARVAAQARELARLKAKVTAASQREPARASKVVKPLKNIIMPHVRLTPKVFAPRLVMLPNIQLWQPQLVPFSTIVNPLVRGDYEKALHALNAARQRLERTRDAAAARKALDEIERRVLDARRALWKREQDAKKKAGAKVPETPAK